MMGLILFIVFHSLTYNKRKRLLSGTIKSGKGVINRISFPSYSNRYGGSADLFFDLQLPSGQKEKGYLRVHLAKKADYAIEHEIKLWFDEKEQTFFPEPAPKWFDPGVVGKEK